MAENTRGRSRRTDSAAQNTIACETCRSKKRRCDRTLPFCLQCAHDPSQCHYPEQNKRGLPLGYVNKLEARLAETEAALFHALSEAHHIDQGPIPASLPTSYVGQNKTERIEEWDSMPLQTAAHLDAWYQSRLKSIETLGVGSPSSSATSRHRTGRADMRRQLPRGRRSEARQMDTTQPARETMAASSPTPIVFNATAPVGREAMDTEPSRAKELSQAQCNVYF